MRSPLDSGPLLELDEVDSTQTVAAAILNGQRGGPLPGVILARRQTQGKGRLDRKWVSGDGDSLTMSLLFLDYTGHSEPWLLGMAVACAAAGALHCRLRWPNDLVLDGRKLGGVLTELLSIGDIAGSSAGKHGQVPVVGIGVNLNQAAFEGELADKAISLAMVRAARNAENLARHYDPRSVANQILDRIRSLPEPDSWRSLEPVWALFDDTPGKPYVLPDGREASAVRVGPDGRLICMVDGQVASVLAGEAILC